MLSGKKEQQTEPPCFSDEAIANRAYQIWQQRGCPAGDGADDWQVADQQLQAEWAQPPRCGPLKRIMARLRNRAAL